MLTLEQKIDICLRWIATDDVNEAEELQELAAKALLAENSEPVKAMSDSDIEDMIIDFLTELGAPPNLKGYDYIACALKLTLSDHTYIDQITARLYPDVAKHTHSTGSCVERCIRHSIMAIFDRGDIRHIQELFGNTVDINKGKLTNSQFLAFSERELRRRIKKAQ